MSRLRKKEMLTACQKGDRDGLQQLLRKGVHIDPIICALYAFIGLGEKAYDFIDFVVQNLGPLDGSTLAANDKYPLLFTLVERGRQGALRFLANHGTRVDDIVWMELYRFHIRSRLMLGAMGKLGISLKFHQGHVYRFIQNRCFDLLEYLVEVKVFDLEWCEKEYGDEIKEELRCYKKWRAITERTRCRAATKINMFVLRFLGNSPQARKNLALKSWIANYGPVEEICLNSV